LGDEEDVCGLLVIFDVCVSLVGEGKAERRVRLLKVFDPLPSSTASASGRPAGKDWRLLVSAGSIFLTSQSLSYYWLTVPLGTVVSEYLDYRAS